MARSATLLLTVAILSSCSGTPTTAPGGGPTPEQAAQNRARPYVEGMAALERYQASTEPENEDSRTVQAKISELEEDTANFNRVGLPSLGHLEREARDRHTSLAFAFAEEALRKGALDAADRVYRRLVEFYVGNAYSGIRERARIGIDDVRARRAAGPGR